MSLPLPLYILRGEDLSSCGFCSSHRVLLCVGSACLFPRLGRILKPAACLPALGRWTRSGLKASLQAGICSQKYSYIHLKHVLSKGGHIKKKSKLGTGLFLSGKKNIHPQHESWDLLLPWLEGFKPTSCTSLLFLFEMANYLKRKGEWKQICRAREQWEGKQDM